MNPEDYVKQRVDEQIAWHSKKSAASRMTYQILTLSVIVAAACIPLLSAITLSGFGVTPLAVGGLGVLITILSGANSLFRFHESWIEYRLIVEALKREKYLYLTGVEPYKGPETFPPFVERIEGLIAKTVDRWGRSARRTISTRTTETNRT